MPEGAFGDGYGLARFRPRDLDRVVTPVAATALGAVVLPRSPGPGFFPDIWKKQKNVKEKY